MINEDLITANIGSKKILSIPLELISERNVNPRKSGLLMDNVDRLVIAEDFPEIHLGLLGDECIVVDGYHRLAATQRLERKEINAFITKFDNIDDLKKQAFIANVNHGIKLSDMDTALNIYEFYLVETKKKATAKLVDIIKGYGIQERKGRQLFYWTVFNREVLENNSIDISNLTKYEDYNKMLLARKEKIGEISDTFKDEFKEFYDKYDHMLNTVKKRVAIDFFIEGKDYNEEMKKLEELEKQCQANEEEQYETIDEEDSIDRNANICYEEQPKKANEIIEHLKIDAEESAQKLEKMEKSNSKKFESISAMVKKNSETFMIIKQLQEKKKIQITREDYNELQGIMDVIESIISDIDPLSFGEMI